MSLESVLQHFQTIAREFSVKNNYTMNELHHNHSADAYLVGLQASFNLPAIHMSYWKSPPQHARVDPIRVPGEWHASLGAALPDIWQPELAPELLGPSIRDISGQQVLGNTHAAPRRLKLDIVGQNLEFIDLKEGIVLSRLFVEPVKIQNVVARTKEKMVVEVTIENPIEKLPSTSSPATRSSGNNNIPHISIKSVFIGAKPIEQRVRSMITIDAKNGSLNGSAASEAASQLANGTVFDVALNAFKRAVINRSHELRAEALGFTAQKQVQERLLEVKAAFEKLEQLCPSPSSSSSTGPQRSLSELIEVLARIDAFPEGAHKHLHQSNGSTEDANIEDTPIPMDPTPEDLEREKATAITVMKAMEEATAKCSRFLEVLCSRIDITLEPSMYFVVGTGVVTGLVTALSIGLLLPEAPVIAAGIGMGLLSGAAVGPLGLGDTVVRAVHQEQDNQYRFLLMEIVKWIGVPAATQLEFLNAYTHERAIEDRLRFLGFGRESDCRDTARWMCWEDETPGLTGALFSEEMFGANKVFDRATKACLSMIASRVEMVRQIYRIRRLIVEETVVAMVGTQDAGKSTAGRILFPHVDREFPRRSKDGSIIIRRGMYEHTAGVRVFPQGRVAVADFPGSDSTAIALDQAMRRFGSVASVALLFCHFNGDASGEVLRNLEEIKEWSSRIPVLLCIHQAGNKVNSDSSQFLFHDELTSKDDVDRFIQRWKKTIQARFPGMVIKMASPLSSGDDDDEEEVLEKKPQGQVPSKIIEDGTILVDSDAGIHQDNQVTTSATATTVSSTTSTATTAVMTTTSPPSNSSLTESITTRKITDGGITIAMTEFAKELKLCQSFGIWGPFEVRKWMRERIMESNMYIRESDLLDILPAL
jgi:hypothetical protein